MALEWSTTAEESKASGVNAIIYGTSGIGKTMLAATAPNPLLGSSEKGMMSLSPRNIATVYGANREDIVYDMQVLKMDGMDDLGTVVDAFERGDDGFHSNQTLVLDSGSDLTNREVRHKKLHTKSNAGKQANGMAIYGKCADEMIEYILRLKAIKGLNVIILAHAAPVKSENSVTGYIPDFAGQALPLWMAHEMDGVWCYRLNPDGKGGMERVLQTQGDNFYLAKTRNASIPAIIKNPHLGQIFAQMMS